MKTRLLLLCCLLNASLLFGVSHTQLVEELDSSFSTKSFDLIELTDEEIINEIEKSQSLIFDNLGIVPNLFAYPFGENSLKAQKNCFRVF